jgi:hypothetical protein
VGSRLWPDDWETVLVTMTTPACIGACPSYSLVVHRDGVVEYRGISGVKHCRGRGWLDPAQLAELDRRFRSADLFRLRDKYTESLICQSSHYISYSPEPGVPHKGITYDSSAPNQLWELARFLEALVDIEQWIGTPAEQSEAFIREYARGYLPAR